MDAASYSESEDDKNNGKKIKIVLHYGGKWSHSWENEEEEEMEYIGGEAEILRKPNMDKLGYFYLSSLGIRLGFNWGCRMWYKMGKIRGKLGYEEIKNDANVADMLFLNSDQKYMHVYYVPIPSPTAMVDTDGVYTEIRPYVEEAEEVGGSVNIEPLQPDKEANDCLALVPYQSKVVHSDIEDPREEDNQQDEIEVEFDYDWCETQQNDNVQPEFQKEQVVNENIEESNVEQQAEVGNGGDADVEQQPEATIGGDANVEQQPEAGDKETDVEFQYEHNNRFDFDWGDYQHTEESSGGSMFSTGYDDSSDENYVYSDMETESKDVEIPEGFIFDEEKLSQPNAPPVRGHDDLHSPVHSDDENQQQRVRYDKQSGDLCIGMMFTTLKDFRTTFKRWSIERGYCHTMQKNESALITTICKSKCGFRIRVIKIDDGPTIHIRSLYPHQRCARVMRNHMVTSDFIANKYLNDFKETPDWKPSAMVNRVKIELLVDIHPYMAYRAKAKAINMIKGEHAAQYNKLWDWGATVMRTNPGSRVYLKTELETVQDDDNGSEVKSLPREIVVFKCMYVRFASMKLDFMEGIRPLIYLDGCHLKTFMGGHLLSAVALDGNNQLFPIALACVDSEWKESWKWFIQTMFEDYGRPHETGWVFMSDQQKGLVEALKELAPHMEHRFCVRHMYENMKKIYKGEECTKKLWAAAGAGVERYFMHLMKEFADFDKNAVEWVMRHDPQTWERHNFSEHTKCDAVQNNTSESWNAEIMDAREQPILSMFEWIRKHLMEQQYEKYCKMEKYRGPICPNIQDELEKEKVESRNWFCTPASPGKYEVHSGSVQKDVNLVVKTCTCRLWQLSGLPCKHVIVAIYTHREETEMYVDKCYLKSTYMQVYKHMYNPVPSEEEWERTTNPEVHPWSRKKQPGRPKKKRVRAEDELGNPYRSSIARMKGLCGNYRLQVHNVRTCKVHITRDTPGQARRKKKAQRGSSQSTAETSRTRCARIRSHATVTMPQCMNQTSIQRISNNMLQATTSDVPQSINQAPFLGYVTNMAETTTTVVVPISSQRQRTTGIANQVPNYAAETIAAVAKRRRPNPQHVPTTFNNPTRARALQDFGREKGNKK